MKMRPFGRLLPLPVAVARTLRATRPVHATEVVALADALGRVAAETIRAPRDLPEFARATWDGYAVRARDTRAAAPGHPVELRLVGEQFAEQATERPVRAGEALAIATGGAMPRGADAVAIFERVTELAQSIRLTAPVAHGDRVARPGSDFPKGTILVRAGTVLDPPRVGAVGATGRATVRVRRRPRVTLIPNGNELVAPGDPPRSGAIFEINNLTLGALVRACGGVPRSVRPVGDDPRRIEAAIRMALRTSDLVIVTGGSSVGEHDFLPAIFPRVGRLLYHGIAVRPGKPTLAAAAPHALVLGMPGHPTSCLANGLWLLLPVLRKLAGLPGDGWYAEEIRVRERIGGASADMSRIVPLEVRAGWGRPTFRDSAAITSLAGANAYAIRPPGTRDLRRGQRLVVRRLLPPIASA
jgi:molybdenum cofactor synthesis domain-containing protein